MTELMTGVVLAGGRSSRFGSNKAVAPWRGKTLTGTLVSLLSGIFPRVLVVGKDRSVAAGLGENARFIEDGSEISHPIVGILAALKEAQTEHIFVTACDMPLGDSALIRAICRSASGYTASTTIWNERPQPLFAVYSKECIGVLRLLLQENRPVSELFDIVRTRFLSAAEIQEIDPLGKSFLDIDTPQDYSRVMRSAHA